MRPSQGTRAERSNHRHGAGSVVGSGGPAPRLTIGGPEDPTNYASVSTLVTVEVRHRPEFDVRRERPIGRGRRARLHLTSGSCLLASTPAWAWQCIGHIKTQGADPPEG